MTKSKLNRGLVVAAFGAIGAALLVAAAPLTTRSVVEARDIALACSHSSVCESGGGWRCCVYSGGVWECDENCKPKETAARNPECVGVPPGAKIPAEIQLDLDLQKKKKVK